MEIIHDKMLMRELGLNVDVGVFNTFQDCEQAFKHRLRKEYDQAIEAYSGIGRAITEAVGIHEGMTYNHESLQAMIHAYCADALRAAARPQKARPMFEDALTHAKDPFARAVTLEFKGVYEVQFGDKGQAVMDHEESLQLYTQANHLEKMARMSSVLAASYMGSGNHSRADEMFGKAIEICDLIIDGNDSDNTNFRIYSKDRALANKADALQRRGENYSREAVEYLGEGTEDSLRLAIEKANSAIDSLTQAVEISTGIGDNGTVGVENGRMAFAYLILRNNGDPDMGDKMISAYRAYNQVLAAENKEDRIQPAAVAVMQPYICLVEYNIFKSRKAYESAQVLKKAHNLAVMGNKDNEEKCYLAFDAFRGALNSGIFSPDQLDLLNPLIRQTESYLRNQHLMALPSGPESGSNLGGGTGYHI